MRFGLQFGLGAGGTSLRTIDFRTSSGLDQIKAGTGPTGSNGWYFNSAGLLVQEADNTPYSIYQRESGVEVAKGMPVYGSKTDLFTNSNDLTHADWTATNCAVAASPVTSPDGTTNADRITADGVGSARILQGPTATNAVSQACGFFVRYTNNQWITISYSSFTGSPHAWFDVQNGVKGTFSAGIVDYDIIDVGGGWYFIYSIMVATDTTPFPSLFMVTGDGSVGTVASGQTVDAWLPGYEDNQIYPMARNIVIPTTTAVTRTADDPQLVDSLLPLFTGGDLRAIRFHLDYVGQGTNRYIARWDNGTSNERVDFFINTTDNPVINVVSGGVAQATITGVSALTAGEHVIAGRIAEDNFAGWIDGVGFGTPDTSGSLPLAPSRDFLGANTTVNHLNGMISSSSHSRNLNDANGLAMSVV